MHIATVARIPLRLHWSFLAVVVGYAVLSLVGSGFSGLFEAVGMGTALFGSVVLHELGHALAARAYGIRTRHITLYPFGGIAAIESMPRNPRQELVIAIAGPAVNGLLTVLSLPFALITGWWSLYLFVGINVVMGLFNLIPAFPMDGGRVLRAALTVPLGYVRASLVAMNIGRAFALLFLVAGFIWWAPSLVLVGGFLLVAIAGERRRLAWQVGQRPWWRAA